MTNLSSLKVGNGSGARNVVLENASSCDAIRPRSVGRDRLLADGVTVTEAVALERVLGAVFPPECIPDPASEFDVGVFVDTSMPALEESLSTGLCRSGRAKFEWTAVDGVFKFA